MKKSTLTFPPPKIAARAAIPPFLAMDVMKAANAADRDGRDIVHMEVGEPAAASPPAVIEAAGAALRAGRTSYTEALGLPALRTRIARFYGERYDVEPDPARVIVTTGSSAGFLLSFLASFDAGDKVALIEPGYPAYRRILRTLGVEPVVMSAGPAERFQPTPALLERALAEHGRLDGLLVASPSNPAGTMLGPAALAALSAFCAAHRMRFLSDEIYHGITYGHTASTALALNDEAIVINSFSKYFCMTGWRIGWLVVPETMIRPIERLAQNFFIAPPSMAQYGALAVFDCQAELDRIVAGYAQSRALLLRELPRAGLDRLAPADGAFYLYADVSAFTDDAGAFCSQMLEKAGVAATPGMDFDLTDGRHHVRFSFAGAPERMATAARRLKGWLRP